MSSRGWPQRLQRVLRVQRRSVIVAWYLRRLRFVGFIS
jgi:hypothetical protein